MREMTPFRIRCIFPELKMDWWKTLTAERVSGAGEFGPYCLKTFDRLNSVEKEKLFSALFKQVDSSGYYFVANIARLANFFLRNEGCPKDNSEDTVTFLKTEFGNEGVVIAIKMDFQARAWTKLILFIKDPAPKRQRVESEDNIGCTAGHQGSCEKAKCKLLDFYAATELSVNKWRIELLTTIPVCLTNCAKTKHAENCPVATKFKQ